MLGWLLVIVCVILIFQAHKLPSFKNDLKNLADKGMEAAKKGKEKTEQKLAELKEKAEKKEAPKEENKEN